MPTPFRTSRRVEFADTDMAGIMHFANFFRFMEAAEQDFLRSIGLSVSMKWEGQSLGFPRVAVSCEYQKPARFEDVLEIAVTLVRVGQKSLSYRFDFSLNAEPIARGRMTCVFCRIDTSNKLVGVEFPSFLRERFSEHLVEDRTADDPEPEL